MYMTMFDIREPTMMKHIIILYSFVHTLLWIWNFLKKEAMQK